MIDDPLSKALAAVDRMVFNCKSASPSVNNIITSSAGQNQRPLSLLEAKEQLLHFRDWSYSAIRLVSQRIAGQEICVGRRPKAARRQKALGTPIEPMPSHPILDVLASPNEYQTLWQLIYVTVASLEITGRALWYVAKGSRRLDDGTLVDQILHVPSSWLIRVSPDMTVWTIQAPASDKEYDLSSDDLVHFHHPDPSDPRGVVSPLSRVAHAILTDEQIQIANFRSFINGVFPSVILTAGKLPGMNGQPGERPTFTPQQREDLLTALRAAYSGTMSSGEPLILDSLIERVDRFSQTALEMDFGGSSKIVKARVLQAFGVSPILLGELENANRASSTVAEEIFCYSKCNPLIELLSATLTQKLVPMFAGPRDKGLVCYIVPTVPHDAENTLKQWDLGLRFGAVSRNQYRVHILNLPAADGLDTYLEPAGMLPQADDDDTPDDAGKSVKRLGHKGECDEVEDGICPACGGELNDDDVCTECGEDWSDCDKGHRVNGHTNRLTAS